VHRGWYGSGRAYGRARRAVDVLKPLASRRWEGRALPQTARHSSLCCATHTRRAGGDGAGDAPNDMVWAPPLKHALRARTAAGEPPRRAAFLDSVRAQRCNEAGSALLRNLQDIVFFAAGICFNTIRTAFSCSLAPPTARFISMLLARGISRADKTAGVKAGRNGVRA